MLAPDKNWSASGHVKTLDRPLRIRETHLADGTPAWCSDGAPSDCVSLAVLGFFPEKIDLVVSGINPNANIGHDVTYSGTVTAAMEAAISGIRGIAFSLDRPFDLHNHVDYLHHHPGRNQSSGNGHLHIPFSPEIVLNVNVPYLPWEEIEGIPDHPPGAAESTGMSWYDGKIRMDGLTTGLVVTARPVNTKMEPISAHLKGWLCFYHPHPVGSDCASSLYRP